MYLHLGGDTTVRTDEIVGIFDLDNSTLSYKTRDFLARAEKEGRVFNVSAELPKSFVLCRKKDKYMIYICQLSPLTLIRRAGHMGKTGESLKESDN